MIKARDELTPEAQQAVLAAHGGSAAEAFSVLASACVQSFFEQNNFAPLPERMLTDYMLRLWRVVNEVGLPAPLTDQEEGEPGEMSAERVAELTAKVMAGLPQADRQIDLAIPTRQLLKACLQPEFRRCRDSYKEVVDGTARRQELDRVRQRISGSHCVDCPYWIALKPEQHAALLEKSWAQTSLVPLVQYREIFLPEKFRVLRLFLWRQARQRNLACPDRDRVKTCG